MYKRILVPLDHSAVDDLILKHVRSLAKLTGATLFLIHVADGYAARLQEHLNLEDSEEIQKDRGYLQTREKELAKEGFQVKSYLATGDPTNEILDIATKEKCDLIAMSTHGHGLFKDFLLGSVANTLRHRTSIPILMIRANE